MLDETLDNAPEVHEAYVSFYLRLAYVASWTAGADWLGLSATHSGGWS